MMKRFNRIDMAISDASAHMMRQFHRDETVTSPDETILANAKAIVRESGGIPTLLATYISAKAEIKFNNSMYALMAH
ncbi:MAG: hypothetical protein DRR04_12935 [Gammaproteobacteria bacterium]|nr:MAG: hypothetical protein DRR04_12935 [Gammaproteobacteria bacterium]